MRSRGVSLIELCFAMAILVIVMAAATTVIRIAWRHQELLWDELVAGELATSALERELSKEKLEQTLNGSRAVSAPSTAKPITPEPLPELKILISVTPAADQPDFVDVRATVSWMQTMPPKPFTRTQVERSARRRAQR